MTNDPYAYSHIHSFRLVFINVISRFRQNIGSVVKGYVLLRFIAT